MESERGHWRSVPLEAPSSRDLSSRLLGWSISETVHGSSGANAVTRERPVSLSTAVCFCLFPRPPSTGIVDSLRIFFRGLGFFSFSVGSWSRLFPELSLLPWPIRLAASKIICGLRVNLVVGAEVDIPSIDLLLLMGRLSDCLTGLCAFEVLDWASRNGLKIAPDLSLWTIPSRYNIFPLGLFTLFNLGCVLRHWRRHPRRPRGR